VGKIGGDYHSVPTPTTNCQPLALANEKFANSEEKQDKEAELVGL